MSSMISTWRSAETASSNICKEDSAAGHTMFTLRILESRQILCYHSIRGITRVENQPCVSHDLGIIKGCVVRDNDCHVARTEHVGRWLDGCQIVAFHAQGWDERIAIGHAGAKRHENLDHFQSGRLTAVADVFLIRNAEDMN